MDRARRASWGVLVALAVALPLLSCGRTPEAGLEGELCSADSDCQSGLVCERRVCLPLERVGDAGGDVVERGGVLFVVVELDDWVGATGGQLAELGRFIADLSTVLSPYYALWLTTETQAQFGRVEASEPIVLDDGFTVTTLAVDLRDGSVGTLPNRINVPVFYSDENVELAFDLPLVDASIDFTLTSQNLGSRGSLTVEGVLLQDDARQLGVSQRDQEFTIFDVLANEPATADVDGDGRPDGWSMAWTGEAIVF